MNFKHINLWLNATIMVIAVSITGCAGTKNTNEQSVMQTDAKNTTKANEQSKHHYELKWIRMCTNSARIDIILTYCSMLNQPRYKGLPNTGVGYAKYQDAINVKNPDDRLIRACYIGNFDVAKQAIQDGANPNIIYPSEKLYGKHPVLNEVTPLDLAMETTYDFGSVKLLKLLLDHGADPNLKFTRQKGFPPASLRINNIEGVTQQVMHKDGSITYISQIPRAKILIAHGYKVTVEDLLSLDYDVKLGHGQDFQRLLISHASQRTLDEYLAKRRNEAHTESSDEIEKAYEEKLSSQKRKSAMEQVSHESNIGRRICKNGTLHYKSYAGYVVMGQPQFEDNTESGQLVGFLEGYSKDGYRIKFRVAGWANHSKKLKANPASPPYLGDFSTKPGIVYWDDVKDWFLCGK